MGKGDKKTRKGKIAIGSFGNSRKRHTGKPKASAAGTKKVAEPAADVPARAKKTARKKEV